MTEAKELPAFSRAAVKRYENETGFMGLCDLAAERGRIKITDEEKT